MRCLPYLIDKLQVPKHQWERFASHPNKPKLQEGKPHQHQCNARDSGHRHEGRAGDRQRQRNPVRRAVGLACCEHHPEKCDHFW